MSKTDEKGFSLELALAAIRGVCKVENGVVVVPAKGIGLKKLSAVDYLGKYANYAVRFEHIAKSNNVIPDELRGKMI